MTVCNMSIEAGARAGMIAPDKTTFEYLRGRRFAPQGKAFDAAVENWSTLPTDQGASLRQVGGDRSPGPGAYVTWGINPGMVVPITARVPDPGSISDPNEREVAERALRYMTWNRIRRCRT